RRHTRLVSDWSSDVCSSDLTMSTEEGAKTAIATLNGKDWNGRALIVNEARPREERGGGGSGRGGHRGGGGGGYGGRGRSRGRKGGFFLVSFGGGGSSSA